MPTRLYFPNAADLSGVNPAWDAAWSQTTTNRIPVQEEKVTTDSLIRPGVSTVTGPSNRGIAQAVSALPLKAQTISGTVLAVIGASENNAALDASAQMVVKVVDSNGNLRGILLAAHTAALANEFAVSTTVMTSRYFPSGTGAAKTMQSVVCQAGDWLVIEIGFRRHATSSTGYAGYFGHGGSAATADRALNQTATTGIPWIEFSGDILFGLPPTELLVSRSLSWDVRSVAEVSRSLSWDVQAAPPPATSYRDVILATPNLLSYWRLGQASGNALDETAAAVSGVPSNVTYGAASLVPTDTDTSFSLNGSNSQVNFGNVYGFAGTASFSVEVWVRPTTIPSSPQHIVSKNYFIGTTNKGGWALRFKEDGTYGFERNQTSGSPDQLPGPAGSTVNAMHLVGTYDGTTMKLYANGVLFNSMPSSLSLPNHTRELRMGIRSDGGGNFFGGLVDDCSLYDRPLTPTEVADHHTAGTVVSSTTLLTVARALLWDVRSPLVAARSLSWNVRAALTAVRTVSWAVRSAFAVPRDVLWSVRASVASPRTLLWNVRSLLGAVRSLSWNVRAGLAVSRSLSWNVRVSLAASRSLVWNVRGALAAGRTLLWSVRASLSSTRSLSWDVRTVLQSSRVLLWDVLGDIGQLLVSRALLWDVRAVTAVSRDLAWSVRVPVGAQRELLWSVRREVLSMRVLSWSVRAPLFVSRVLEWIVESFLAGSRNVTGVSVLEDGFAVQLVLDDVMVAFVDEGIVVGLLDEALRVELPEGGWRVMVE